MSVNLFLTIRNRISEIANFKLLDHPMVPGLDLPIPLTRLCHRFFFFNFVAGWAQEAGLATACAFAAGTGFAASSAAPGFEPAMAAAFAGAGCGVAAGAGDPHAFL